MTINQIRYFLTLADCQNFTKAANQLYITQPALSRQIKMIEEELGVILFVRTSRKVKLTPSALILQKEFQGIYDQFTNAVREAQLAYKGVTTSLKIGILEGTRVDNLFPKVIQEFSEKYPNVDVQIRYHSFKKLIENINNESLDLSITLEFEVEKRENLAYKVLRHSREYIVVPKTHRLAGAPYVYFSDFAEDTFIMVSPEDSEESPRLIKEAFQKTGKMPKIKYAPSISTEMLWVEAGLGICMLDTQNIWFNNPEVSFLECRPRICNGDLVAVWNANTYNDIRDTFVNLLETE